MINMKTNDAIKLDSVKQNKTHPEKILLPEDGLYRYLYQPRKKYGDLKR